MFITMRTHYFNAQHLLAEVNGNHKSLSGFTALDNGIPNLDKYHYQLVLPTRFWHSVYDLLLACDLPFSAEQLMRYKKRVSQRQKPRLSSTDHIPALVDTIIAAPNSPKAIDHEAEYAATRQTPIAHKPAEAYHEEPYTNLTSPDYINLLKRLDSIIAGINSAQPAQPAPAPPVQPELPKPHNPYAKRLCKPWTMTLPTNVAVTICREVHHLVKAENARLETVDSVNENGQRITAIHFPRLTADTKAAIRQKIAETKAKLCKPAKA